METYRYGNRIAHASPPQPSKDGPEISPLRITIVGKIVGASVCGMGELHRCGGDIARRTGGGE